MLEPTAPLVPPEPLAPPVDVARKWDSAASYRNSLLEQYKAAKLVDDEALQHSKKIIERLRGEIERHTARAAELSVPGADVTALRAAFGDIRKLERKIKGLVAKEKALAASRIVKQRALLFEKKYAAVKPHFGPGFTKARQANLQGALDDVGRIIPQDVAARGTQRLGSFGVRTERRLDIAGTTSDRGRQITISRFGSTGTSPHEFGHRLEEIMPGWRARATSFRSQRSAGEAVAQLPGYRPGVKGVTDRFKNVYSGRVYVDKQTEVISNGVEELWANPLKFAREDPEYFDFIVSLLKGF